MSDIKTLNQTTLTTQKAQIEILKNNCEMKPQQTFKFLLEGSEDLTISKSSRYRGTYADVSI